MTTNKHNKALNKTYSYSFTRKTIYY